MNKNSDLMSSPEETTGRVVYWVLIRQSGHAINLAPGSEWRDVLEKSACYVQNPVVMVLKNGQIAMVGDAGQLGRDMKLDIDRATQAAIGEVLSRDKYAEPVPASLDGTFVRTQPESS